MKKKLTKINKEIWWNTKCEICGDHFTAHGVRIHKAVAHNKTTEMVDKIKQRNIRNFLMTNNKNIEAIVEEFKDRFQQAEDDIGYFGWAVETKYSEVENFFRQALQVQRKKAFKEAIELAETIERNGPDGSTEQWKAFKHFRNTLRDKLKQKK